MNRHADALSGPSTAHNAPRKGYRAVFAATLPRAAQIQHAAHMVLASLLGLSLAVVNYVL